jgi:photosystem II stability/assembly factor-like uncharacterized protein
MKEHRDRRVQADEDKLLRRWYAASSQARPIPSGELLARSERVHRTRRTLRNLAMAAVTIVAIVAGIAGAGAWASFRSTSGPSNSSGAASLVSSTPSPAAPSSTRPHSPGPSIQSSSGPALAEHEYIVQMHRTSAGGWLLTGSRLLVTDGSTWRNCWTSNGGDVVAPYPYASVSGDTIRIFAGTTMWTSIDDCASWAHSAVPIAATGAAFPTASIGYVTNVDLSNPNQGAQIYKTSDGGRYWNATPGKVAPPSGPYGSGFAGLLTLTFADTDHGWLTDTHTLWTTANGGEAWTRGTLPVPGSVHGQVDIISTPVVGVDGSAIVVAKYDATPGMDGARGQRVFYRTVDRGAHWTAASVITDPGMLDISLADATTWVVLDPYQSISLQVTGDAGATWQTIAIREPWPYNGGPIDFADSLHGWMVVSESYPPCPPPSGMPNVHPICDYAYAPPQHLVATNDGGATWVELKP